MPYSLTWLPDVLRAAGLEVLEHPGWQDCGHGDMGDVKGVLCHHTCGPLHGDLGDLGVLVDGRSDLGGPLCNLGLGRSGKFYMIAAGKGWHAGVGYWQGISDGNAHLIGVEAENTGETAGPRADPWPAVQMDAYRRGVAAILSHIGAGAIMCAGHKEFALPKGRKDDPSFDMSVFRADVAKLTAAGSVPKAAPKNRDGFVRVDGLNVRASASARSIIIGILNIGDRVSISAEVMNGKTRWFKVGDGFVSAAFVEIL